MLSSIPLDSKVFIDSNVFLYHFTSHYDFGENCSLFLLRCASQEVMGYTSTNVIIETMHRLLIAEAVKTLHLSEYKTVDYLKKHQQKIKELSKHSELTEKIKEFNLTILQTSISDVSNSHEIRKIYGLLTNDSIIVSMMKSYNIVNLATNDSDFDNIKHIRVFKPKISN